MSWLPDYSKRIKLTLDNTNVDDTLSDFPVLVKLSDSSGISSTDITSVFTELNYPSVDDDFTGSDDDPVNTDLWDGTGIISNNMVKPNSSFSSEYELTGDFDIEIYWDKTTGTWGTSDTLAFKVFSSSNSFHIYREYNAQRITGTNGSTYNYSTYDWDTGYFRVLKVGTNIKLYFKRYEVDSWIQRSSFSCVNEDYTVTIYKSNTCTPSFDSFKINSGTIIWPQGTHPNRKKIAVTTSDETTQCYVEIERFDYSNNQAWLWVKAPSISSSSETVLYLYYDSTQPDNTSYIGDTGDSAAQNVWDSNFKLVMHMAQDPNGDVTDAIKDSTSNANHGTPSGSMTSADLVDGKIGKGIDFDGDNDCIDLTGITTGNNNTISLLANFAVDGINSYVFDTQTGRIIIGINTSQNVISYHDGTGWSNSSLVVADSTWHSIAAITKSDGTLQLYVDDNTVYNDSITANSIGGSVALGARYDKLSDFVNGLIDEVRISNIIRSAAWIKATYYSNWDGFVTFSEAQINPNEWSKRIKLTIDNTNVDGTLSDFPALVKLSDSSGISSIDVTSVFTELGSDGNRKKIAITISDGTTQCYVEIERFDYANSVAELWVKVPTVVSGTTTDLYLYYDSNQSDNTSYVGDTGDTSAQNVWDSNFKLVMHMAQDPNGDVADAIKDSTSNANHGTPAGSMTSADLVDGKIGKCIELDGIDDVISISNSPSIEGIDSSINYTVSFICKTTVTGDTSIFVPGIIEKREITTQGDRIFAFSISDSNKATFGVRDSVEQVQYFAEGSTTINDDGWHDVVGTKNVNDYNILVNGILEDTLVNSNTLTSNDGITIGARRLDAGAFANFYADYIEEVRFSAIARSAAWTKATYYSNWDELVSFEFEEEEAIYYISGYVTEGTAPVNRQIYLHNRDTGALLGSTTSSGTGGYFYMETTFSGVHYVVCLDDAAGVDYNDLIYGKIYPTISG